LLFVSTLAVPLIAFLFFTSAIFIFHKEINLFPEEIDLFVQLLIFGIAYLILANSLTIFRSIVLKFKDFTKDWDEYSIVFTANNKNKLIKEWIFQGNPIITTEGLVITNTNSGLLIKPDILWTKRVWKNFEATLKVNFRDQKDAEEQRDYKKLLGVVFRAQNLQNYFMLEIWKMDEFIVIRPHVRVDGNWDAPILNPKANTFKYGKNNDLNLLIKVINSELTLIVDNSEKTSLTWILPSEYEINLRQHEQQEKKDLKEAAVKKISFRLKAGMFGFRNYGDEIAVVKSLSIRPFK
jgi:hypothetical protein